MFEAYIKSNNVKNDPKVNAYLILVFLKIAWSLLGPLKLLNPCLCIFIYLTSILFTNLLRQHKYN
jgi:hypothetical protein